MRDVYAVSCPDGENVELFYGPDEKPAEAEARRRDAEHDQALCDSPHRLFVACYWQEVIR